MKELPLVKKKTLTERFVLPIDTEMSEELHRLKEKGVHTTQWVRQILRRELNTLKLKT